MKGRNAVNMYINFHINWIIDFAKAVLPKENHKTIDNEGFKNTLYKYYTEVVLKDKSISDILDNSETKELMLSVFMENKIIDEDMQILFASLFKEELILSWSSDSIVMDSKEKDLCFALATIIKIALDLGKRIGLDASKKTPYSKVSKEVLSKYELSAELLKSFKSNKRSLIKIYNKYAKNNLNFIERYNKTEDFKIRHVSIYGTTDNSRTNMFLSDLDYSMDELKGKDRKRISRMEETKQIKENLKKIELELVSFEMFEKLVNKKDEYIFVDLYEDFLSKRTNITFIENTICAVKDRVVLNIGYDQLLEYEHDVKGLKEAGYNFSYTKGDKEISFKKMFGTKYFFLEYSESISFSKTLKELKLGKIEPIVLKPETLDNPEFHFYMK